MYFSVRVVAGAKKEKVEELAKGRLKVVVKEKAERNAANKRVKEIVAEYCKVPGKKVRLVSGHISPSKMFLVDIEEK